MPPPPPKLQHMKYILMKREYSKADVQSNKKLHQQVRKVYLMETEQTLEAGLGDHVPDV